MAELLTVDTLGSRLRTRLDAIRGGAVPASMRSAVDRIVVRVREALDLPSRGELLELTQRLEDLDRRIGALAAERVAEMTRVAPALPAPEAEVAADAAPVATDGAPVATEAADTVPSTSTRRASRRGGAPRRARRK